MELEQLRYFVHVFKVASLKKKNLNLEQIRIVLSTVHTNVAFYLQFPASHIFKVI